MPGSFLRPLHIVTHLALHWPSREGATMIDRVSFDEYNPGVTSHSGRGRWGEVESEWGRRLESVSRYLRFLGRVACITSQLFIRVSK